MEEGWRFAFLSPYMAAARGERVRFFYLGRPDEESRRDSETVRDNYQPFTKFSGTRLPVERTRANKGEALLFGKNPFRLTPLAASLRRRHRRGISINQNEASRSVENSLVPLSKYRK
jgi:hypothetical protein